MDFHGLVQMTPEVYHGVKEAADCLWMVYSQEVIHDSEDQGALALFYIDTMVRSVVIRLLRENGEIQGCYVPDDKIESRISNLTSELRIGFNVRLLKMAVAYVQQLSDTPTVYRSMGYGGLDRPLVGEEELAKEMAGRLKVIL